VTITVSAVASEVLYRVNAGGDLVSATPNWQADSFVAPSPYVNAAATGNQTYNPGTTIDVSDPSVPPGTPPAIFKSERWDPPGGAELQWDFPVTPGNYRVQLYFAETYSGIQGIGQRVFDVAIEGTTVLNDYDVFAAVGANTGVMVSFTVNSDANLDIDFDHVVENPAIKAIEIIAIDAISPPLAVDDDLVNTTAGTSVTFNVLDGSQSSGGIADSDSDGTLVPATVTVTGSGVANGTLINNFDGTFVYTPDSNFSGVDSFTYTVSDNDGLTSNPATVTITVSAVASEVLYRVNAGGDLVSATPNWQADSFVTPSPYVNAVATGNQTFNPGTTIDVSDPSVPPGTPPAIFQSERYDPGDGPELQWDFPVTPGNYRVQLYFAETYSGIQGIGQRVFDVAIEGITVLNDYDVFAAVGANKGVMVSFIVNSDANLDIDFDHVVENPAIKAIEIIAIDTAGGLGSPVDAVDFGPVTINSTSTRQVSLLNYGGPGDPDITITGVNVVGGNGAFAATVETGLPVVVPAGGSTSITVNFTPNALDEFSATLNVSHSGLNDPFSIPLLGGTIEQPIAFQKSVLANVSPYKPTSLQFGPDGRLYVAQQDGAINAYTITRNGPQSYDVTNIEVINLVKNIVNHDDNGVVNNTVNERLITGILVIGTAQNPIMYVTSSDPRIGAGDSGTDLNLDTNSGMVSRLTWNGESWDKLDLVRGLPRSEENHGTNGLQIDLATNTLYVAIGGNTNMGAPSKNFALLPEYALSAAILSIDLNTIGETTYDLPTLDDEDNPGADENDPFGGNDGKNQAILVPGGPVQVYAPGFRNPYDLLITSQGRMYTVDNGPNGGWGGVPIGEGPAGNATNDPSEPGTTFGDGLHFISAPGYYGGHPNPTRSNPGNTFNASNPQSPVTIGNPIESDYQAPQPNPQGYNLDGSLVSFPVSTGGLEEYTATNFGGQLQRQLLLTSFDNTIKRIELNAAGDVVLATAKLFSSVGGGPLDVTAQGDDEIFPGTIWVADYLADTIVVFEPIESSVGCPDDDDCDGYTNADEIANGTAPNNPGDVPADWDQDFISDLLDPDDDNDSQPDTSDRFAVDSANGSNTPIGTLYTWENNEMTGGLLSLGFTGLMSNAVDNYKTLFDPGALTAGGAAGVLTLDAATTGTALGAANSQQQALQFGFDAAAAVTPFTAYTSLLSPFAGLTPNLGEQAGLFLGTGDQDNYVQIVVVGTASGQIELQVISEVDGTASTVATSPAVSATNVDFIELFLQLDPTTDIMQASFQITRDGTAEGRTPLGPAIATPSDWTNDSMAVGIISTDPSPQSAVPFTWDFLGVVSAIPDDSPPQVDAGSDATINGLSVAQSLNANVIDSSNNGIALRTVWNLVSGPATVSFADPYAIETDVSFTAPGVYVLRLTADNGAAVVEDDVTITVLDDTRGLITSLQVVDPANGQGFGTLSPSPLEPGDILWPPISITADQVNNFAGSADGTTGSTATGSASFFYDASTNLLNYSITYQNLTADLTNIHIHGPANTGQSSAAHIFEVFSSTADVISAGVNRRSDTIVGAVNLTSHTHGGAHSTPTLAEALAALSTGQAYINVHSEAFPMGEIRGNVSAAVAAAEPFFDLGTLNTTTLRFEPSFTGDVASVSYSLDGVVVDTDNLPGDGFTWAGTSGDHNLVVTAYSDPNASGVAGPAYAVQFGVRVATNQQTRLAEWQTLAKAPYAQFEGQGAAVNGKIYLFGGFFTGSLNVTTQGAVYDPVNDIWTSIADSPVPLTHASHAVDGDKIYVVGGYVGDHPGGSTDQVWIYDTVSDGWTAGPRLPADRGGGGAAILGRRLYYFGGATRDQGNASSATDQPHTWSLDLGASDSVIDDGVWTRLADLPSPRNHMAGAAVGPFVYALGGQFGDNESNGNSNLVHRYDPTVNAWTQVASLPLEIGHISASTFTSNGRIFVVTGVTQDSTSTDTIFMYDPATDTWTALPPAPAAAQSPLSVTINGQIYIIGGDEENIGQTDNTYALDLNESWFNLPSMPVALGEVAGGIIGQTLYLVGEGSDATLAYDLGTGQWKSVNDLARRLYAGNHHAAETIDGKLYLFGGLGDGSDGKVQIYDPLTDSWSLGANVPFSIGSAATALIAGKVYLAGGIIGSATTNQAAVYDPAADTWTSIASMPEGVNHAAAATDGARFYLFGGRTGGNVVGDGFDYVQVYDPATGVWNSSTQGILAPLPESRGGTGRAVYLNNEFYIFGGETSNSPVATPAGTYDRVDIYNPTTNAWRLGVPMPTARHGIFPVEHAGVIYLAGGGMNSGFGQSNLMQAYYADVVSAASEASPARNPYDTNGDGGVTTLDALVVINALSQLQIDSSEKGASTLRSLSRLDANRDGKVTALDALVVINHLARQTRSIEPVTIERDQSGWAMATDRALQTLDTDDDAEERLWLLLADDQRGLHTNIF
jgi:N-acetylneuraminic acid mutarotase